MPTIRDILENSTILHGIGDAVAQARYGVPWEEKEAMAIRGDIPGADPRNGSSDLGQEIEQRRAAAYLFGRQWPTLGPWLQPGINALRYVEGDDPRVIAVAPYAVKEGAEAGRQQAAARQVQQHYGVGSPMTIAAILGGL